MFLAPILMVYICLAIVCSNVDDCNTRYKCLASELLN